ncbi:helix-turn-helix transcriptional regulator [Ferrimicrobium acidiphilum]|uniref:helix-turn-helix transcriptional regulator n=1 Tax=Ferrimicrobium acidiphilum TaxID=121039 RepID=UPI0023F2DB42|nr:helix-turn-helix domain-containing protein [Ferrimicrobium acidiphilum]
MTKHTYERRSACLMSIEEAAIRLGVERSTAYRAIKNGTFPVKVIVLGGRYKVPRLALDRLLNGEELYDTNS